MELWDESNPEEEGWTHLVPWVNPGKSVHSQLRKPIFVPPKTYKPKSKSFPVLQGNPNIWAIVLQVTKDIEAINWKSGPLPNLPSNLKRALNSLPNNDNLVVKPSNKGGKTVILNREGYEKMCYDTIHNREWYKPVPLAFVSDFKQYMNILNQAYMTGTIDDNTFTFLNVGNPQTHLLCTTQCA